MSKRAASPLIVHVDDRETNRYTVRKFLESAGFTVEQATNGTDGLELVRRKQPDLVILDVKLPDITGYELCKAIKNDAATASTPVMHVSAHFTDAEARVEGLESGADAYLTSISPNELLATVRALLRAKNAEETAVASAAEWQTTFDSVSDPIFILTFDYTISKANTAAEQLLACASDSQRQELLQQLQSICSDNSAGDTACGVGELHACNRTFRVRVDQIRHFGNKDRPACVCVLADITDFRTAEIEIRRMNDQLLLAKDAAVQANRAKSAFLASMSHELRTPLNAIIGYTEMLQEDANSRHDVENSDDLARINSSAKHLLTMVADILDLSRIEAGRTKLNLDSFEVATVLEEAVSAVRPLAEQRGNTIIVEADNVGAVWSDAAKLHQVLLNLLSNACKFTTNGTITVRAGRTIEDAKEWVRFEVEDTGIGIELAKLSSIFEAYAQAESEQKYVYGGTGLGLSISRRLAELLGGTLTVLSTRGEGSTFIFSIMTNLHDLESEPAPVPTKG